MEWKERQVFLPEEVEQEMALVEDVVVEVAHLIE
jgi:hypothetical protein